MDVSSSLSSLSSSVASLSLGAGAGAAGTRTLTWAPPDLPFDVQAHIMSYLLVSSPRVAFLINSAIGRAIRPYQTHITLSTSRSLELFAERLADGPSGAALARRVRSLWIAPLSLKSDFLVVLAPHSTPTSTATQQAHRAAKAVLRACRGLKHVALDGAFLTRDAASAFGTACKPISLLALNPHSYVGGFGANIFAKCRRLDMWDGSLTVEEVDEIRAMPDLREFIWTSPREHNYVSRDISLFTRILAPSLASTVALQPATLEQEGIPPTSDTPPPEKRRRNVHLRTLTMRVPDSRAASVGTSLVLAAAQSRVADGEVFLDRSELQAAPTYVDSSAGRASAIDVATGVELRVRPLPSDELVDEWDALRESIGARDMPWGYSRAPSPDEDQADAGMVMQRCWSEWTFNVTSGRWDDL